MSKENNAKIVRALHDLWCSGDVDKIPEIYSEDFLVHWPHGFKVNESHGYDGVREAILSIKKGIPDWYEDVKDMIVSEDKVVTRYTSTGTHKGTYAGVAATGKKMSLDEISIYRIADGKVAEQWCLSDDVTTLLTLGILTEAPDF